jgi:hypothetical protein
MSSVMQPFRMAGRGALAAALVLALTVPQMAQASGGSVWAECVQGGVSTNHSQKDFKDALDNPPADAAEYSDCLDQIRAAQVKAARGDTGTTTGTTPAGTTGSGGGTTGGGTSAPTVAPEALQQALASKGINPSAPAGTESAAPAPAVIAGEKVDLDDNRLPSIANAFSLPLPLAASAVVVMFSAALPVIRFGVGRFGRPPLGTSDDS